MNFEHPFVGRMREARADGRLADTYRAEAGSFCVPIRYRGVRTFLVTVPAKLDALREIAPADVRLRRLFGDYGALVVQFVDLPDTSIGPYTECTIAIVVDDKHVWPEPQQDVAWSPPPCYALWLSVSSELARDSGQAIWGYPKTLGDTQFEVDGAQFRANVRVGDTTIISCEADIPEEPARGSVHMRSLTHLRNGLCRTAIIGECAYAVSEPGRADLRFHPGSKISESLAALPRLDEPASTVYIHEFNYNLDYPLRSKQS